MRWIHGTLVWLTVAALVLAPCAPTLGASAQAKAPKVADRESGHSVEGPEHPHPETFWKKLAFATLTALIGVVLFAILTDPLVGVRNWAFRRFYDRLVKLGVAPAPSEPSRDWIWGGQ